MKTSASVLVVHLMLASVGAAADSTADVERGRELFAQRCAVCHSLDHNKVGPRLGGAVGRQAGSLADYDYSPALRAADFAWDAELLQRWLAGPTKLVPGTKMPISLGQAKDRADVAAYLATTVAVD